MINDGHLRNGKMAMENGGFSWDLMVFNPLVIEHLSGWWLSHPSEKYESQLG